MKIRAILGGLLGAAAFSSIAVAQPIPAPAFQWGGFYVGGGVVAPGVALDAHAGFNIAGTDAVLGLEVQVLVGSGGGAVGTNLRLGIPVGVGDRFMPYGSFSVSRRFTLHGLLPVGAVGLEVGIGDRMSIYGQVGVTGEIGPTAWCCGVDFRAGINIHFGN